MKKCGIYGIFNTVNNKVLIGSSGDIEGRWKRHISNANRKAHCNSHFQASWTKYGKDFFEFKIIEECVKDSKILIKREDYWMLHYNSLDSSCGYNMQDAQITFKSKETCEKISKALKGRRFSDETKKQMSESAKVKIFTKEHRRKIGEKSKGNKYNVGRKASAETKRKLSESRTGDKNHNYGKHLSSETKRKLSNANKGKKLSEETKLKISIAISGDRNPNYGKEFSDETKKKMSDARRKRITSDLTRQKLRVAAKGRVFTKEHKKKLSESIKRSWEKRN